MKIQCSRCSEMSPEFDTNKECDDWFNEHRCDGMRDIYEFPIPLLERLVAGEITEAEAWEIFDNDKK